jgi:hypothetical protein
VSATDAIDVPFQPLAVREPAKGVVTAWTPRFVMPIAEMVQASEDMTEFQRRIMVKDVHYGTIPGTDKPTLLKPGAELLLSRMGLHAADPTILSETIDYGECDADGAVTREGLIRFSLQVNIYHQTGALENERILVGSGIGAATSREKKYRWRDGAPTCPECGKGLRLSKNAPEWYCWAKMGGCGATFPKAEFQQVGRVPNPELGDLENTIFKMAKKRALIDATLVATGCSNAFTQDVGDDSDGDADPNDLADAAAAAAKPARGRQVAEVARVPQDELLALARAAGIFPPGAPQGVALAAFGAWAMANGVDFNDGRRRKLLTDAETQAAKALLEDLASAAAMLGDRTGGDEPPPRMAHRTQGRLFALMGERLGKDHDDWHDFAAQHGVALATKGGKPTFTGLSEAAARALIAKLEVIPPSEWAKPPAAPAPVADEDDEDGLLAYARERIGEPR